MKRRREGRNTDDHDRFVREENMRQQMEALREEQEFRRRAEEAQRKRQEELQKIRDKAISAEERLGMGAADLESQRLEGYLGRSYPFVRTALRVPGVNPLTRQVLIGEINPATSMNEYLSHVTPAKRIGIQGIRRPDLPESGVSTQRRMIMAANRNFATQFAVPGLE